MAKTTKITMAERNRLIADKVLGLINDTVPPETPKIDPRRTKRLKLSKCTTRNQTPLKTLNLER